MACPNYQAEIERLKTQYPTEWKNAHTGNDHTEDFVWIVAEYLHALDPNVGLNGKRGNPDDISDDALNILDPLDGPGRTPEGQRCWVVDFIRDAGLPTAAVVWQPFSDPVASSGANVIPGPPPTPAPVFPPYPGDAVFDDVGVKLFADYATAGYPPDSQMGRWFGRTIYDWLAQIVATLDASIAKHQLEWREALNQRRAGEGLPPIALVMAKIKLTDVMSLNLIVTALMVWLGIKKAPKGQR